MGRKEARVFTSIWHDADFLALSAMAQRMYLLALSQAELSYCGVVPYTAKRWARLASDTTVESVEQAVMELTEARFLVVDEDTEELWIRSFVKNDGCWKNPRMEQAIRRDFQSIHSGAIAHGLTASGYLPDPGGNGGPYPGPDGGGDGGSDPLLAGARAGASAQRAHTPSPTPSPTPPPPPDPVASAGTASGAPSGSDDDDGDEELNAEVERRYQAQLNRGATVANPKAWKTKARKNLLAEIAAEGRGVLEPPPAKPPEGVDLTAAAQRARAARNDAKARGEACVTCDGSGWVLPEDADIAAPCRACGPHRLSVVGE